MQRRSFIQSIAVAGCIPVAALLESCAASAPALHVSSKENVVTVPLASLPDLSIPDSYAKVYVDQLPNPILLFQRQDGSFAAVSSTCSHSGCEVKKRRSGFECPCHGSEYDLSGTVTRGPASESLDVFEIHRFPDRLEFTL